MSVRHRKYVTPFLLIADTDIRNWLFLSFCTVNMPHKNYSTEQMCKALLDVSKGMNFLTAAKKHNVPRTSLKSKYTKKYKKETMGPAVTLPEKYENDLVIWLTLCAKNGFPINREQLCDSVKRMVIDFSIPNKFKNNRPGYKWVTLFLKRHPFVTVHKSQLQEKVRKDVTQQKIDKWFDEIETFIKNHNLLETMNDPSRVFNCDESAFFLAPGKNYVLVPRSERQTFSISGNNEKENLTALIGSNAIGNLIPPMIVFKYERIPKLIINSVPTNWGIGRSKNRWMTCAVFYEYITNIFHPWLIKNKIKLPIVLFLDGHISHLSLQLSEFCIKNGIHLIALYPHATHLLQPMDVAVFKQMKDKWKRAVINWKFETNEIKLPKEKFSELLNTVLSEVTGIENGFRKCGLFPFGRISIADTINTFKNGDKDDSPNLSWNERYRFSRFIEGEIGKLKIQQFKENKVLPEDKSLYQIWKKLNQPDSNINNITTFTLNSSSSFIGEPRGIDNNGTIAKLELSPVIPMHSTPVKSHAVEVSSNKFTNSSPNFVSPHFSVLTPIEMLHWPKYVAKKKGTPEDGITNKTNNETGRVPFAITSKAWQQIFKEKEDKKEQLEQEKKNRKQQREQKKIKREKIKRKRKALKKKGPTKKFKESQILEDENSDFELNLEEIWSPEKNLNQIENMEFVTSQCTIKNGDFIVGKLIYDFGTRKESQKNFIGQVLLSQTGRQKNQFEISFLRKMRATDINHQPEFYFVYPNIVDKWRLIEDQIIETINLKKTARGKYYFDLSNMNTNIDDIE